MRRSLGPQPDVEDIVQEVVPLLVSSGVHTLRIGRAQSVHHAITVRTVRTRSTPLASARVGRVAASSELARLACGNADTSARQALIHFYRALERINERDRAAFVLRFVEGMEAAEVAVALDVSVPTARRRFTRAWERVTFFAQRDPFLVDYLSKLEVTSSEEPR